MMNHTKRSLLGLLAVLALMLALPATGAADEVSDLIATLESDAEPYAKDVACRRLAVVGTAEAVPALAALLANDEVNTSARTALINIPGPEAAAALRDALDELTGRPLVGVIEALGVLGDAHAVEALVELLGSDDADVAPAAARALGQIGAPACREALVGALASGDEALRAAGGLGCLALAATLAEAGDTRAAVSLLDAVRRAQVPAALVAAASVRSVTLRGDAGASLVRSLLSSSEPEAFGAALRIAREVPGSRITAAVAGAVAKGPASIQVPLIEALGHRGDPAALPAVTKAAGAVEPAVRVAAVRALAQIGDASVVDTLLEAAASDDEAVANAGANALAALQGDGVDAAVAKRLADPDAAVAKRLADPDAATRAAAVRAAGQRRMTSAIPALVEAAGAKGAVREAAIRALGQTCGPKELPDLADILVGLSDPEDIALACSALTDAASRIEDKQLVADVLVERLGGAPIEIQCALMGLLKQAPVTSALDAIRAAIRDRSGVEQQTAYTVLGEWPTPEAAPDLLALAKAGGAQRDMALTGYIRLIGSGDLSPETKTAMCKEAAALVASDGEKDQLLTALATTPTAESLAMVMSYIDNPALQGRVCWAAVTVAEPLEQSHAAQVVEALTKVLEVMDNPGMERRVRSSHDRAAEAANR